MRGAHHASLQHEVRDLRGVHGQGQEVQLQEGVLSGERSLLLSRWLLCDLTCCCCCVFCCDREEDYMKIRRWRFVVKCSVCSAEISFKTDPKNTDYEIEYGARRNFEVWKDNSNAIEEDEKASRRRGL